MSQSTTYKRSFAGSVGSGMKSVMGGNARRYYILEHKVSSKYHKAGESQRIIVDQIEIGRNFNCQVRFDETFETVSRRHAAIVKDGDNWKLVQLSETNSTYLNGHKVEKEWYLQSGDEIQLSTNGPKLGFIVPQGDKGLVKSIGMTARLNLFRQQALRPYKQAIATLACLFVLCACSGGYVIWTQKKTIEDNTEAILAAMQKNRENEMLIDELNRILTQQNSTLDSMYTAIEETKRKATVALATARTRQNTESQTDMSSCHPYVYHIIAEAKIQGTDWLKWTGTGFLLEDGKFVTARHVTTPYYSNSYRIYEGKVYCGTTTVDSIMAFKEIWLNSQYLAGNAEITYKVSSTTGHMTFSSQNINEEGRYDQIHTLQEPFVINLQNNEGNYERYEIPAGTQIREGAGGYIDYAYIQTEKRTGLKANREISSNLRQSTELYILGYPHGWGAGNPILSTAVCSQNGLSEELGGTIMASNNNTEGGNSGGPVFIKKGSSWEVVAIVSGSNAQKGRFVPIKVIP